MMIVDYMLMRTDDLSERESPSTSPERPTTPSKERSSQTRASALRRNSVSVACERCRRRKIRCSGLPGPCTACSKFNVSCLDPGKRKPRSQSVLEDRIRRLEALATTRAQIDPTSLDCLSSSTANSINISSGGTSFPGRLQIQTSNLETHASFDDFSFYSNASFDPGTWSYPATPSYSDIGPDVDGYWSTQLLAETPMDLEPAGDFKAITHRRSHTFPAISGMNQSQASPQTHTLLSPACSDLPSIQITSHDGSRSPSPSLHPMDSSAFTFPFRDSLPIRVGPMGELSPQAVNRTPPLLAQDFSLANTNMDYYGDYLSPLDRPPAIARRPSISSSKPGMGNVSEWSERISSPTLSTLSDSRPKRRHTTCGPLPYSPSSTALSPDLSWMFSSPRTTNYLTKYFSAIHPQYPFLDQSTFLVTACSSQNKLGVSPFNDSTTSLSLGQFKPTAIYTRLLAAAIGATVHHQSRDIAARYIRHAMALSVDSNLEASMFSSISGIHAAMLLAIYLYLEQTMIFTSEDEDTSHPEVNLWVWNCRIVAGCIDLGLHVCSGGGDANGDESANEADLSRGRKDEIGDYGGSDAYIGTEDTNDGTRVGELYRKTFRSAFLLDRQISAVRKRPRAIHEEDVDRRLIADLL